MRGRGGEGRRKRMRSYLEAVDGAIASQVHRHLQDRGEERG